MIQWGTTPQGKQRWRCTNCLKTGIKKRSDRSLKNTEALFERWLLTTETLERLAHLSNTTASAIVRSFKAPWSIPISPLPYRGNGLIVIVDGIRISDNQCILIALDGEGIPITWLCCLRENTVSWGELFTRVRRAGVTTPALLVSDAQKGLLKAMEWVFASVPHQRCMTHVVRLAQAWLTRHPQTLAGQELLALVRSLYDIHTHEEAKNFEDLFDAWYTRHHDFLKEKSGSPETKRRWYTHRRLRAVRSLIAGAINDLFIFLRIPNAPRTTNALEGGINSPIKSLLRHHRGMTSTHKRVLVFRFLRARQKKKYQH